MKGIRQTRRGFIITGATLGAAAAFSPWTRYAHAQGSVLKVRIDNDIDILDPGYMTGGVEIETLRATMPMLVDYAYKDGELTWATTPFVESVVVRDPLHIDFELRPGLQWSKGFGEFTAEDVKFSYERMKTTDWGGNFEAMERVDVTGTHSGTIVMNTPFAPFIATTLCGGPGIVLCKAAVEKAGGKFTTEIPATCGPYVYDWTPKQRIVFTRNPEWTGEAPAYDEVRAFVIEEIKAAELAFEAGEVDCTEISSSSHARWKDTPPAGSSIRVAGALQYMWLGMNTEHAKLADIRVRKAIQHAVDASQVIAGAYSGTTEQSYGIVCPGLVGHRTATGYDFNPDKARALLSEAGVSGLELELRTLNVQERVLAAQIIQAQLQAVGITTVITPLDSGPFWDMGQEAKGETWKDLQLWLMRFGTNPDPQEACQWFVGSQVGVWNWERWKDPEYDALYTQGLSETDAAKREAIYHRMQEIMENTGAYVWINHEPETFVHRSAVDIVVTPSGEMRLRDFRPA